MTSRRRKAAVVTLGCPKNQVDSEVLAGLLRNACMDLVNDMRQADLVLINTCGFIRDAIEESHAVIEDAVHLKNEGCVKQVIVAGCLPARFPGRIETAFPGVDRCFGVEPFREIQRFLNHAAPKMRGSFFAQRILSTPPHLAYLKIADGCGHRCTFCTIPMIKGPYRSRPANDIVAEARMLVQKGVKELTLVAQDSTAYGSELNDGFTLEDLVRQLDGLDGLQWIRVMYGHPDHLTDAWIDVLAEDNHVCRYLDVPLQHIADSVLTAMGRGRKRSEMESLIETVRSRAPGIGIRTTFIVGFPGETDAAFDELIRFVETVQFDRLGVFIFSPEEGTRASTLQQTVPQAVAEERYNVLMQVQQHIAEEANRSLKGQILPVMVDGYDPEQKLSFGRCEKDAWEIDQTVWIHGALPPGEIVPVRIEASSAYDLLGSAIHHV